MNKILLCWLICLTAFVVYGQWAGNRKFGECKASDAFLNERVSKVWDWRKTASMDIQRLVDRPFWTRGALDELVDERAEKVAANVVIRKVKSSALEPVTHYGARHYK